MERFHINICIAYLISILVAIFSLFLQLIQLFN